MSNLEGFVERRKYKRFKAKEGIVAEFHKVRFLKIGKPRLVKSVPISDISLGGLGFQYTSQSIWPVNFDTLSISTAFDEIRVDHVPFQTITDFSKTKFRDSMSLRKCGVKFGELTSNQKSDLNNFIHKHTPSDRTMDRRIATDRRKMEDARYSNLDRREKVERRRTRSRDSK